MRYFLAPRSGEKSYQNFLSTIKHGVPYERIERFLDPIGKQILRKEEVIYSWGNREGRKGAWENMSIGDTVIFYAQGDFVMAGRVIYKQYSSELALAMWPPDENGQPWAYTFFLNELRYFKIPLSHFNFVSGYNFRAVMGFQEITSPYKENILKHYKDFDLFFNTFSDTNSEEIPKEHERVFINVPVEVSPTLSEKKIVSYIEPTKALNNKKRSGYVDFEEVNKNRAKIGSLGENIVVKYEKNFLISKGRKDLAEKVHQVSLENTYAGYDVLSYDETGEEKKIEVKSTISKQSQNFSFHLSRNEKKVAEDVKNYFIYLVYNVKTENPAIHIIENPFRVTNNFSIEPVNFVIKGRFSD